MLNIFEDSDKPRKKKALNKLLDKYGESREAISQYASVEDWFEYQFAQPDKYLDEVLEERRIARQRSTSPKTPYPSVARENKDYVAPRNLPETEEENISKIDYSKYGEDFSKEFINTMLNDKRFAHAMARTNINEGKYVNHPNDRGGETNYGISSKIYPNEDIKNMTPERASAIYYRDYWIKPKINQLPDDFAEVVFDNSVVQGQPAAIMNLQKALGIHVDGIIGSDTLNAVRKNNYKNIRRDFITNVHKREDQYLANDPSQKVFEKGHRNRFNHY